MPSETMTHAPIETDAQLDRFETWTVLNALARLVPGQPPPALRLIDVPASPEGDPDELLKKRYLCRGGGLLIAGPTGIGKSSFTMQLMVEWALGYDSFGIMPARP